MDKFEAMHTAIFEFDNNVAHSNVMVRVLCISNDFEYIRVIPSLFTITQPDATVDAGPVSSNAY